MSPGFDGPRTAQFRQSEQYAIRTRRHKVEHSPTLMVGIDYYNDPAQFIPYLFLFGAKEMLTNSAGDGAGCAWWTEVIGS
jgi:hypothetical protein